MTNTTTLSNWLDSLLGDINPDEAKPEYPFGWRVGCVKMASPRHERFDIVRDLGASLIEALFCNKDLPAGKLTFVFPERHMSVHEQQAFTLALMSHKNADNITSIDLITSSPLIIGNFHRESIRILSWDDDEKHSGRLP